MARIYNSLFGELKPVFFGSGEDMSDFYGPGEVEIERDLKIDMSWINDPLYPITSERNLKMEDPNYIPERYQKMTPKRAFVSVVFAFPHSGDHIMQFVLSEPTEGNVVPTHDMISKAILGLDRAQQARLQEEEYSIHVLPWNAV